MTKYFCDICGTEIKYGDKFSRYKLKKQWHSWYESGWERLMVHDECWKDLCDFIVSLHAREKANG